MVQMELKDEIVLKTAASLEKPIEQIVTLSQVLMEGKEGPLKQQQQERVLSLYNQGKKASAFVSELEETVCDDKLLRLQLEPVQVDFIDDTVQELLFLLNKESVIKIETKVAKDIPYVHADNSSLRTVIVNLVENAVKYTKKGKIIITVQRKGNKVEFSIEDQGIGIESKDLNRIFDTFYQVSPHKEKTGLGLGLSKTRKLVTLMGGELTAASELGEGSTFTFSLPVYEGEISEYEDDQSIQKFGNAHTLRIKGMKPGQILLVIDSSTLVKKMSQIITGSGYSVIACNNEHEALNIIKSEVIDVVIIDLKLNEMNHLSIVKKVRAEFHLAEMPILVLSASGKLNAFTDSFYLGINGILKLPLVKDEVVFQIQSLLDMKEAVQRSIQSELMHYHGQITPHFLYNTFNTIIGLSYNDIRKVRESLEHLAVYFRSKLDYQKQQSLTSIEDEVEFVQSYLSIEKLRFGSLLTVHYDIDETIDVLIPALTIQPLVENAVQHGISKKKGGGTVTLSIQKDHGDVIIIIKDDGVGIPETKQQELTGGNSQGFGFLNPFQKLKLLNRTSFHLFSEEGLGTTITIVIPVKS